jgi:thiol-disulfide isomerase/thioredoxin
MVRLKGRLFTWLAVIVLFVCGQLFVNRGLVSGAPPSNLYGHTLDGETFELTQFKGRPSVVYFWASWCPVCERMQGTVKSVAADHPLISLALQSGGETEVRRYMHDHDYSPMTLLDEDGAIGKRFGLRGVPALFVLGPEGDIRYATAGYTSELGLRLRLWLAAF